jgi:hypothetical protein
MVQIPTTQRKFYNTTAKTNTLAAYAEAFKPAVQNANKIFMEQQKIKIDTRSTQARIEADEYVNNMRLKYQGNPDSPEFKQAISGGLNDIFNRYGEDIDPMAKGEWNLTANKMTGAYDLSNNEWIIKQRADNAKLDIAENINANLKLARRAGSGGNWQSGIEDFKNSYGQLFEYAQNNLGETDARKLLKDYEQQYMTSFINGMAESNPAAALKALEQPEVADMIGDEQAQKTIKQLIKKQKALYDHNNKVNQVNLEYNLSEKLDSLPASDALHLLEANEANVSTRYYKAKRKALLSNLGITAETQADEASEILMDIDALNKEDAKEYYKGTQNILSDIEERYAEGHISAADRNRLIKQVRRGQGKNIDALKKDNNWFKFWEFSFKDANEMIEDNYTGNDKNRLLLNYFREVSENENLDNKGKKQLLMGMIETANGQGLKKINNPKIVTYGWKIKNGYPSFDTKEEAIRQFKNGRIKKGDSIYIAGQFGEI